MAREPDLVAPAWSPPSELGEQEAIALLLDHPDNDGLYEPE